MRHLSEKMSSRLQCCSRHVAQGRHAGAGLRSAVLTRSPIGERVRSL